jgi:hypothetical protein
MICVFHEMLIHLTPKIGKKSQGRVIASFSPCLAYAKQSQVEIYLEIATPANGKTRAG